MAHGIANKPMGWYRLAESSPTGQRWVPLGKPDESRDAILCTAVNWVGAVKLGDERFFDYKWTVGYGLAFARHPSEATPSQSKEQG